MTKAPEPRKGMPSPQLDEAEFRRRFLSSFQDPAFDPLKAELDKVAGAAWDGYSNHRKSPRTRKAGPGYADPVYDLALDWIGAKEAVDRAQAEHDDADQPPCILIVNCSSRSEHTCPGEMSKSWRLLELAQEICGVDRTLCRARTHDGVQLVDEEHDASVRALDLGQHRLQTLFEFAAELSAGD